VKLLDLFCGAGGASAGYSAAGYEVTGVDVSTKALTRYPYDSVRADALDILNTPSFWGGYDLIHASPPCQTYSISKYSHHNIHPDLLGPTLEALAATGKPWVVENVPLAPLENALTLCGTMFGLTATDTDGRPLALRRHRLFACTHPLTAPAACSCLVTRRRRDRNLRTSAPDRIGGVYGGGSSDRTYAQKVRRGGYTPSKAVGQDLMGIRWMTRDQLAQAIPPAYTYWIGQQLLPLIGQEEQKEVS
jgi:DNA (cytosine-5)-methyltransferase 1